jgi:hypothetical protein
MTNGTTLTYQVFVTPIIATAAKDLPPGQSRAIWSPISATLISGRRDAVLVDARHRGHAQVVVARGAADILATAIPWPDP